MDGKIHGLVKNLRLAIFMAILPVCALRAATITGTVTTLAGGVPIEGATVTLVAPAQSVTTNASGQYTLVNVPNTNATRQINVSMVGYLTTSTNVQVTGNLTYTANFSLDNDPNFHYGIITGTVRETGTNSIIAGATVTLTMTGGSGPDATTETNAQGQYSFLGVPDSITYTVSVGGTGHLASATTNVVVQAGEVTALNFSLVAGFTGNMYVYVGLDSTGNPPIAGATVYALRTVAGSVAVTGVSDSAGWVRFMNIPSSASATTNTYAITVSKNGFEAVMTPKNLTVNDEDTTYFYLARTSTTNSKTLSGTIAAEGPIAGALVTFRSGSAGGVGARTILTTVSDASGRYSFAGIANNAANATGSISIQRAGYTPFTSSTITLNLTVTTYNVVLAPDAIAPAAYHASSDLRLIHGGPGQAILRFTAAATVGSLEIYDLRGGLRHVESVPAGTRQARLSELGTPGFVLLRQGSFTRRLMLPLRP